MRRCGALIAVVALVIGACRHEAKSLTMATTTSVDNSGLLAWLAPKFRQRSGIDVRWIPVGSGKAIRMALDGKVLMTITHDEEAEKRLLASKRVLLYRQFMRNDFVIVGPAANPAGLTAADSAVEAFRKIAASNSRFCSRNDQSGTHTRELRLWRLAGRNISGSPRYLALGQPMSAILRSASELGAYTLTDRATFCQLQQSVALSVFVDADPLFANRYALTVMRGETADEEARNALEFASWLLSTEGRSAIAAFRIGGAQQFFPLQERGEQRLLTLPGVAGSAPTR